MLRPYFNSGRWTYLKRMANSSVSLLEATKIFSNYSNRWVIEKFFRNAKQLSDMEGTTIRSKRGITLSLCIVSWIDFLLHHKNYKKRTAIKFTKESLTIPSIVRQAQYDIS